MKVGKNGIESRLFITVDLLNKRELETCKRAIFSIPKSSWKQYHIIFEKCLKSKDKQQFLSKMQGEKGSRATCRYLCEKIVETLAGTEEGPSSSLKIIDKAIQKEIYWLAKNTLTTLFEQIITQGLISLVQPAIQRKNVLERIYDSQICLPPKWDLYKLLVEAETYFRALRLQESLKSNLKSSDQSHPNLKLELADEIDQLLQLASFPITQLESFKAARNWCLLSLDLDSAKNYQQKVLKCLEFNFSQKKELIIQEKIRLASFLISTREFDAAQKQLMELALIPTESERLETYIESNWIKYSLFLCACSGNQKLGEKVIRDFYRNKHLFSGRWKGLLYYCASIIFLHSENYNEVLKWQGRLARLKKDDINDLLWVSPAIRFVCYYELGILENAKTQVPILREEAKSYCSPYIEELANLFDFTLASSDAASFPLIKFYKKIDLITQSPSDSFLVTVFDIRPWLLEKIGGVAIGFSESESNPLSYFSLRLA